MKRLLRIAAFCALGFFLSTIALTLLLRFFPPLTSGLMMERRIESWFSDEPYQRHYQWTAIEKINPALGVAVVAAEDQLFAEHAGFDWKAIEKAAIYKHKHTTTRGVSTMS